MIDISDVLLGILTREQVQLRIELRETEPINSYRKREDLAHIDQAIKDLRKVKETITSRNIPQYNRLRLFIPATLRERNGMHGIKVNGLFVGITDQYGTCHYAIPGYTKEQVEEASRSIREVQENNE